DPDRDQTFPMRGKEEAHDYRYFPDPDLLPLEFDDAFIDAARASLPELPDAKKRRFVEDLGLPDYNALTLAAEKESAEYFEMLLECLVEKTGKKATDLAARVSNWMLSELFAHLNKSGLGVGQSPVAPDAAAELLALVLDDTISGRSGKDVLAEMIASGRGAVEIVEEKGLRQVSDTGALEAIAEKVLAANPAQVEQYRAGKTKVLGFFVGQVMKETRGQANPGVVNRILKQKLDD
ncbi:MAG: Asp-tRNA(Asn)/Glu-tRNA(Gln) amidotransferase GatCAB subunit B, partial [Alphaproteobacteria bacterium]